MNIKTAEDRYLSDPQFHALVDAMYHHIETLNLTPSEMREAAMYACILFEQRHVKNYFRQTRDLI